MLIFAVFASIILLFASLSLTHRTCTATCGCELIFLGAYLRKKLRPVFKVHFSRDSLHLLLLSV